MWKGYSVIDFQTYTTKQPITLHLLADLEFLIMLHDLQTYLNSCYETTNAQSPFFKDLLLE